ncbi:MAG: ORF6N domain-containing protein [Cytophagales bacterium]
MQLQKIRKRIYEVRGQNVMLDFDLAGQTKHLKDAVRHNIDRFPNGFMFELTWEDYNSLRAQFANSPKAFQISIQIVGAFVSIRQ